MLRLIIALFFLVPAIALADTVKFGWSHPNQENVDGYEFYFATSGGDGCQLTDLSQLVQDITGGFTVSYTHEQDLAIGNIYCAGLKAYNAESVSSMSEVLEFSYEPVLDSTLWSLVSVSSEEPDAFAVNAFDNDASTIWHTEWFNTKPPHPHEIVIDLGTTAEVHGFQIMARQGQDNARIKDYEFYVSTDGGSTWTMVSSGTADGNLADTYDRQSVFFSMVAGVDSIKLVTLSSYGSDPDVAAVSELDVIGYNSQLQAINNFHVIMME